MKALAQFVLVLAVCLIGSCGRPSVEEFHCTILGIERTENGEVRLRVRRDNTEESWVALIGCGSAKPGAVETIDRLTGPHNAMLVCRTTGSARVVLLLPSATAGLEVENPITDLVSVNGTLIGERLVEFRNDTGLDELGVRERYTALYEDGLADEAAKQTH